MSTPAGHAQPPTRSVPKVSAKLALTLLVLINLFNYIDRQVLSAVEPAIRRDLFTEPSGMEAVGAKAATGWFATVFLLSYMLVAPLFGLLADRMSRWWIIGFGVLMWSLASGASGVQWGVSAATAYWILLVTRCFVGVGEAAYGPVAPAMIADLYPMEKRGRIMAWFYLALPVGGALGYALGGIMDKRFGEWPWAFYSVVPPGIILGIWCFLMPDPKRGQMDQVDLTTSALSPTSTQPSPKPGQMDQGNLTTPRKLSWRDYLFILTIPSYALNTAGMTMMSFAIGGLAFWMPEYLEQRHVPDVGALEARTVFGIITACAGLISTLLGGFVGDWLRPRFPGSYFLVSGIALWLGFPMILLMLWSPFPLAWVFIFLAVFFLFFNAGPTNTILANVIHPSMRGTAYALNILIIHALGDAISPPLIGWISGTEHLDRGFILVSLTMLIGGIFWLMGAKFLQRDTQQAPFRLPE